MSQPGEGPVDPKQSAAFRFSEVEDELRAISRWLLEHPELANQEHRSSARLAAFLRASGFEVEAPAWGLATAFDAVAGGEGPEVVICAEYDALPEVGHACGHNIIAAAALGCGAALRPLVDMLGIRLRVVGTPAEESHGGKVDLIEAGAFGNTSAAMMIHPADSDLVDPRFQAIAALDVAFHGKESHAAFAPQLGVNALDAAVQAYVNVSTLRQALYPTDSVHGVITYGGAAPNVIPSFASMAWYVRSESRDRLTHLRARVEDCFHGAARATGCEVEVTPQGHSYDTMVTDAVMADVFSANSRQLGRPMNRNSAQGSPAAGSSDMGNLSHLVPAIHPMLDINTSPYVNHQHEFAAHTVSPDGDRAIRDGALSMAWTVIDLAEGNRWDELGTPLPA